MKAAMQVYREALGEGIWYEFSEGRIPSTEGDSGLPVDVSDENNKLKELEEDGVPLDVPAEKATLLFNLARLHEQLHETHKATILYQLLLFKVGVWRGDLCSAIPGQSSVGQFISEFSRILAAL
jgi:RNA polymerase-associated protein CTR9